MKIGTSTRATSPWVRAIVRQLQEGWRPDLHPRDRKGQFRDKPDFDIGVTPYRGVGRAHGEDYFDTARYKGFENALPRIAERTGVLFEGAQRARGIWAGGGEPSAAVHVRGDDGAVRRFMDSVASRYDQDAVISFRACRPCPGMRYVSAQPVDPARAEAAMKQVDLPGGTITQDGHLELIDLDDSSFEQIASLADILDINLKTERGRGELRLAGQHYTKGRRRRAAQEASALHRDGPGGSARNAGGVYARLLLAEGGLSRKART